MQSRDFSNLSKQELATELALRTRTIAERIRDVERVLASPRNRTISKAQIARKARVSQYLVNRVLADLHAGKPKKLRARTDERGQVLDYVLGQDGKMYPARLR